MEVYKSFKEIIFVVCKLVAYQICLISYPQPLKVLVEYSLYNSSISNDLYLKLYRVCMLDRDPYADCERSRVITQKISNLLHVYDADGKRLHVC